MNYAKKRGGVVGDDVDVTTHDFEITDSVWPDAGGAGTHNYAQLETDFRTQFWDQLVGVAVIGDSCGLLSYKWYRQDSGDLPWGDPARVQVVASGPIYGSGATCPPQISCTVTEQTPWRRHWGRFYVPGIATTALDNDGSLTAARTSTFANVAKTLYDAWATRGVKPIVLGSLKQDIDVAVAFPTASAGNLFERWLGKDLTDTRRRVGFPVDHIRVDDVLDVQRRRRFESPLTRTILALA